LSVTAVGQWFSPGTPVSFTNKSDHHNITEILLKVALNTIAQTLTNIVESGAKHHKPILNLNLQKVIPETCCVN
jgi:hypothetical protein